ncbi:MAG: DNA mismatch repair endonuclease MutL [Candidatus Mcinerneyibacterium aminivorans]|uniref:DNA mismatch repair protein MutL n=1 Tax=Candidatus Mcinerneyibacterium aminivorans TaxID=2703815 RepID=A0A5D0MK46_9BACT|nr:MAG: DNA mismatch repair endonuclease MutL [Candidatus Mcinerneyibacterium aminivorans]
MIKKLDKGTINKIAAGEVVERPFSVVKELVENSLDAEADSIKISIKNSPVKYLEVKDNGTGIKKDELELAFQRHATSKIENVNDLFRLNSLGFRGEALPSIASVSYLTSISKHKDEDIGAKIVYDAGKKVRFVEKNRKTGTTVRVERLFYNVPARKKYLKNPSYELRLIKNYTGKLGLAYSFDKKIEVKLDKDGKNLLHYSPYDDFNDRITHFYGKKLANNLLYFEEEGDFYSFKGYISSQNYTRKNSKEINFYINDRIIKNRNIIYSVKNALSEVLESREYPYLFLFVNINPTAIDMNVHPQKLEARISNERKIYSSLYHKVKGLFEKMESISEVDMKKNESSDEKSTEYNEENNSFGETAKVAEKNLFENMYSERNRKSDKTKNLNLFDHRFLDVVFGRYLLFVSREDLLFVDFHALNERIFYDRYKEKGFKEYSSHIIPEAIELGKRDYELLMENKKFLKKMGIKFRDFGNNSIVVETLPAFNNRENLHAEEVVREVIENLEEGKKSNPFKDIISSLACKTSLKSGDKLNKSDIKEFIKYIEKGGMSLTCPHGRPVIKKLKKEDIDSWFKR